MYLKKVKGNGRCRQRDFIGPMALSIACQVKVPEGRSKRARRARRRLLKDTATAWKRAKP